MNTKYLNIDNNLDIVNTHAIIWAEREIGVDRVDNMAEGIEKLLNNEYICVAINSDTVDFMGLLSMMRSITDIPILIGTSSFTTEKEIAAIDNGADLYARFHEKPEGNIASVLSHINRKTERSKTAVTPPKIMVYKNLLITPFQHSVFVGNIKIDITPKEFDVLHMLMENKGGVFSPEQIYEEVWASPFDENAKEVIRTTIKRLRQKLQINPQSPEYIKTIRDVGYVFGVN